MTEMPIVISALGTVIKGLIKELVDLEIRERVKTIQTTALLRSARILRRVLRDLRRFDVTLTQGEKTSAYTGVKTSKRSNNNNNNVYDMIS